MKMIRELTESDMRQANELKVLCWQEELAKKVQNTLSVESELVFWIDWMHKAQENDIRLCLGAFEDERMLGVTFSSLAETSDIPEQGIELNGLWVFPDQRGRGVSLLLLLHVIDYFLPMGKKTMVIYNHHYAPSNKFYEKFGASAKRRELQKNGRLLVDVLFADMRIMRERLVRSLKRYL